MKIDKLKHLPNLDWDVDDYRLQPVEIAEIGRRTLSSEDGKEISYEFGPVYIAGIIETPDSYEEKKYHDRCR